METRWFTTWRHVDVAPLSALVTRRDTKEEAEKVQREWLKAHEEHHCHSCWRLTTTGRWKATKGDNSLIVSRVRTEKAVYKTLGF